MTKTVLGAALLASAMAVCVPVAHAEGADNASYQPLADKGVVLSLSYTAEAAANPSGGLDQKSAYTGQIYAGVDADLGRLVGVPGGSVHVAVTDRRGKSLSQIAIGNNTSVQEVWGTQNIHLAIATYEQKLFGDALDIEAGRSQANIHFLNSSIYCNFQTNSTCGNPTMVFKDSNFTYFPASSWMAHAKLALAPKVQLHAGIYEVNPLRKTNEDNGFNLSTRGGTGFVVPWELNYLGDHDALPTHVTLGGWVDRGDYADPLTGATDKGRSGLYLRADRAISWDARTGRGLQVFGVAMANVDGRVEEAHYLELGVLKTGTLAGRDEDTIGFLVNDQHFSKLALQRMSALQVAAGGTGQIHADEYMMELNYGAQLGSSLRVMPNLQYILHPDQSGAPTRATAIPDAFVVGVKFTIDAFKLAHQLGAR